MSVKRISFHSGQLGYFGHGDELFANRRLEFRDSCSILRLSTSHIFISFRASLMGSWEQNCAHLMKLWLFSFEGAGARSRYLGHKRKIGAWASHGLETVLA